MDDEQREELIDYLAGTTKIPREYYESLDDRRILEEWDKIGLIY